MDERYFVMWWVPAGHRPTVQEAIERLEHLKRMVRATMPSAGRACRPRSCGRPQVRVRTMHTATASGAALTLLARLDIAASISIAAALLHLDGVALT